MANWQHKLDLTDVWGKTVIDGGEITIQQLGKIVSERLLRLKLPAEYKGQAEDIAFEFDNVAEDTQDFDSLMNDLYDLGDSTTRRGWPPDKLIWIATNF